MNRYFGAVMLSCLVSLLGCKPASEAPADAADAAPKKVEAEAPAKAAIPEDLDLVILNGRVMDPETKLDAVRNVGIKSGKIVTITEQAIKGTETIDAKGHVVAPGFIDTHWHSLDPFGIKIGLRDGVTTAMDIEAGAHNVAQWYAAHEGKSITNYGTTASQIVARLLIHDAKEMASQDEVDFNGPLDFLEVQTLMGFAAKDGVPGWSVTRSNREQANRMMEILDKDLRDGALGVGAGPGYMRTGVTTYELFLTQKTAANYGRLSGFHARFYPSALTPIEHPMGFNEVFANAFALGAPLIYQHNVDYGWYEIEQKLAAAREKGLNMWSEMYPWEGASTIISAEFFQPDVYEAGGNHYGDGGIYDPQLDKFYSKEEFLKAAKADPGRIVVGMYAYRKPWIVPMLRTPHMTIAADAVLNAAGPGAFDKPFSEYEGNPRTSGTRGKVLRLARENGIPLMDILANTSYYAAKHLGDAGIEAMQIRGRMQEGMVADITIFDPENVRDNSTYKAGEQGTPTTGIPYVIINGQIVVKDSKVLQVFAGQPIRYPVEDKGRYEPVSEKDWLLQFPEWYK